MQSMNLTNHFLIAMPAMDDPYFSKTLIYIAEHNDQGALGLIVNRPIDMDLATLFEKIAASSNRLVTKRYAPQPPPSDSTPIRVLTRS